VKNLKAASSLAAAILTAALASGLTAACTSTDSSSATQPGNPAGNVNDLQSQQEHLTIDGYNAVQTNPAYQYVAPRNPLELANQKEKLARFNDPSKVGYLYAFVAGTNIVFFSTVEGKISDVNSSMTSPVGVFKSYTNNSNSAGGGNVALPLPGDDLSYGPNECGDLGVFWFDTSKVLHEWCSSSGPWMYVDAPITLPSQLVQLQLPAGSKPSNTGATAPK
jgi:hypothetical protein